MEPEPTFAEVARILRPGGVFAAYDYDWPPVVDPELDEAFDAYQARRGAARERVASRGAPTRGRSTSTLLGCAPAAASATAGRSCSTPSRTATPNASSASRAASALPVADTQDEDLERELRIDELEEIARRVLGDRTVPFVFGYRVRIGVR